MRTPAESTSSITTPPDTWKQVLSARNRLGFNSTSSGMSSGSHCPLHAQGRDSETLIKIRVLWHLSLCDEAVRKTLSSLIIIDRLRSPLRSSLILLRTLPLSHTAPLDGRRCRQNTEDRKEVHLEEELLSDFMIFTERRNWTWWGLFEWLD